MHFMFSRFLMLSIILLESYVFLVEVSHDFYLRRAHYRWVIIDDKLLFLSLSLRSEKSTRHSPSSLDRFSVEK
jgi:hypothetical protein